MAKRSLKASPAGIVRAKQAFQRREWTQDYLAATVGLQTRQPIWKFFSGRPIERHLFIDICFHLDLDWEEIVDLPRFDTPLPELETSTADTQLETSDQWVQQVRSHVIPALEAQCGVLQVAIDVAHPVELDQIYTEMLLLPRFIGQQRVSNWSDLRGNGWSGSLPAPPQSGMGAIVAVETYARLMILGKPGAGKTTLLQYLALRCAEGSVWGDRIPVFLPLRCLISQSGTVNSLEIWLQQQWAGCHLSGEQVQQLLQQGKVVLLLDGLDEVPVEQQNQVHQKIQTFADTYHLVPMIITGRLASREHAFRGFTSMEVADFEPYQISTFVQKWFAAMAIAPEMGMLQAQQFLDQLHQPENQPIFELAITPILLHLICLVFRERGTFPRKRSHLYQAGLDILLVRWDRARGIERHELADLSLADRLALLSKIAAMLFERGQSLFETADVLPLIVGHLKERSSIQEPEQLWLRSTEILRAIACHHGLLIERGQDIYSFSHLTFQEYLTARRIFAATLAADDPRLPLEELASHITDARWHEVIGLTAELLPNAASFMTQLCQQSERYFGQNEAVQQLLQWSDSQLAATSIDYNPTAIQAFYLGLAIGQNLDLATTIDPTLSVNLHPELALDRNLFHLLTLGKTFLQSPSLEQALPLCFAFDVKHSNLLSQQIIDDLEVLQSELLSALINDQTLQSWCQKFGLYWLQNIHQTLMKRNALERILILNLSQHEMFRHYYHTLLAIVQLLQREIRINAEQRSTLITQLFTPKTLRSQVIEP